MNSKFSIFILKVNLMFFSRIISELVVNVWYFQRFHSCKFVASSLLKLIDFFCPSSTSLGKTRRLKNNLLLFSSQK